MSQRALIPPRRANTGAQPPKPLVPLAAGISRAQQRMPPPQRSETPSPFANNDPTQPVRGIFANQRFQDEYEGDEVPMFPSSQPEPRARMTESYRPPMVTGHRGVAPSPLVPRSSLSRAPSIGPSQPQYSQYSTMEEHQVQPPPSSQAPKAMTAIIREGLDRSEGKIDGLVEAMQANRDGLHDLKTSLRALPTREEVREEVQEAVAQSLADVVSSLTSAVQDAVKPLVKTTSVIASELEKVKTAVANFKPTSGSNSDGDGKTNILLELLINRLKPIDELKDALHNVKDLPQAIIAVTTFADAVSLIKAKVDAGTRDHEVTPPATQTGHESQNHPPMPRAIPLRAGSSTLNWLSQPPPGQLTPTSPALPADTVAAIKLLHDDIAYLKVAGMGDLPAVLRKFTDVAATQGKDIGVAGDRLAELGKRMDTIEAVAAARKSDERASLLDPTPTNVPTATSTLKRKAAPRKPKAEPTEPLATSALESDVFGAVEPSEAPANKKKKAAPKKRAVTTAAPRKPAARAGTSATASKKAPARSATTAPPRVAGQIQQPVIVLDSDDSLESRSPDSPDHSPLADLSDSNVITMAGIDIPMHVTRSVVRRLSSPVPSSSGTPGLPSVPPAGFAGGEGANTGIGNAPPAGSAFATGALFDDDELMDEAAMDAAIGIF